MTIDNIEQLNRAGLPENHIKVNNVGRPKTQNYLIAINYY